MNIELQNKLVRICEEVAFDVENDAKAFDGKPFTGKVVAEYFGNHGAEIKALADILKELIQSEK